MGKALRIIEKAMLIYLLYPSTSTEIPIVYDYKKSPKLQFLDTGLLCYFAGLQPNFFTYSDLCSFYQGVIAEHIARQEIIAQDSYSNAKISFWVREKKQANAEVDILLQHKNHIIPVEVKAGTAGTLRSLHQFINNSPHRYAIRLYAGEYNIAKAKTPDGTEYNLLNLPYFLAGKIYDYIDNFITYRD
jgi:predicted AAA+ superfamily ATPase